MAERTETQQDRCSAQRHLWRRWERGGQALMACRCGAVHPADLDEFLAGEERTNG